MARQPWQPNNFKSRLNRTPLRELILEYIQNNPSKCAHARYMDLARQIIVAYPDEDLSESSVSSVLSQLKKKRILLTQPGRGATSWNINYAHRLLPQCIRDGGTEEEQNMRETLLENLQPGQTLENDGTITMKDESVIVETNDDPFDEGDDEETCEETVQDEPSEETVETSVEPEEPVEVVEPVEIAEPAKPVEPVEAVIENKDGAIKLSLTINININGAK